MNHTGNSDVNMSQGNICPKVSQKRNSYTVCHEPSLVKSNIFCVYLYLVLLKYIYAYISQLLQKVSNKRRFELPHSALDNGVSQIFLVCARPMVLVPVEFLRCS